MNQKWSKAAVGHSKRDFKNTVLLLSKQNLIKLKIGPVQILQHPRRLRSRSSYLLWFPNSNLHRDLREGYCGINFPFCIPLFKFFKKEWNFPSRYVENKDLFWPNLLKLHLPVDHTPLAEMRLTWKPSFSGQITLSWALLGLKDTWEPMDSNGLCLCL